MHVRNIFKLWIAPNNQMVLNFRDAVRWQWRKVNISIKTLFYNHFMDQGYIADVCMEPMFWFVDNFTKFLGPVSIIYN